MRPNDFPVSKVDHLSPRKNRTVLVLFFSINFMLCALLLPKIQPLLKPENRGAAMPSFRKKLLRFMLGRRGHFSTTFSGFIPGVLDAAIAAAVILAGKLIILGADPKSYTDSIFDVATTFIPPVTLPTQGKRSGIQKFSCVNRMHSTPAVNYRWVNQRCSKLPVITPIWLNLKPRQQLPPELSPSIRQLTAATGHELITMLPICAAITPIHLHTLPPLSIVRSAAPTAETDS